MPRSSTEGDLDEQQQQQLERRRKLNREAQKRFRDRKQQAKRKERGEEVASPSSSSGTACPHDYTPLNLSHPSLGQPLEHGPAAVVAALGESPPADIPSSEHPTGVDPIMAATVSPVSTHSGSPWADHQSLLTACSFTSPFSSPPAGQASLGAFHLLTTPLDTILSANEGLQWQNNHVDGPSVSSDQSSAPLMDGALTSMAPPTPPTTTTMLPVGKRGSYDSRIKANAPSDAQEDRETNTKPKGRGDAGTNSLNAALFLAAEHGHAGVVRTLVQSGADVNAADENGNTSLHLAIRFKHQDVVTVLLRHNARRHVQNFDGLEPLQLAAKVGFDVGVKLLLRGT